MPCLPCCRCHRGTGPYPRRHGSSPRRRPARFTRSFTPHLYTDPVKVPHRPSSRSGRVRPAYLRLALPTRVALRESPATLSGSPGNARGEERAARGEEATHEARSAARNMSVRTCPLDSIPDEAASAALWCVRKRTRPRRWQQRNKAAELVPLEQGRGVGAFGTRPRSWCLWNKAAELVPLEQGR